MKHTHSARANKTNTVNMIVLVKKERVKETQKKKPLRE